ncbi:unnamed protein product [Dovyalis caffra]|uniref:Uncharacterized protein n=1 Tax=Dovyalis caffra TaxID=77055 RepID=A0AAV1RSX7_9ROSI|nr:unnamed protein product [Dovyalis caffra]
MCYKVQCKQCKRYSWGGCGKHLTTVYASIDKGNHCMCKSWPGVVVPVEETATEQQPSGGASSASATTTAGSRHQGRYYVFRKEEDALEWVEPGTVALVVIFSILKRKQQVTKAREWRTQRGSISLLLQDNYPPHP